MVVLAALICAQLARSADDNSHAAPAPSTAERLSASEQRREVLAEMWQRKLIAPDAPAWSLEDWQFLQRIRRAEAAGAVAALRRRFGGIQGLIVEHRPVGALAPRQRLTKEGYERYLSFRTQDALAYFESKEIGAKTAFKMTDVGGHPLFDGRGLLTEAGEAVFDRAQAGVEAHWKMPSGEILGNRRPPPRPAPAPEPAPVLRPRRRIIAPPPAAEPAPEKAPEKPPEKAEPEKKPDAPAKSDAKPAESENP